METIQVYEAGMEQASIEALQRILSSHFPVEVHDFKPQALTNDKKKAICPAYIDLRHYQNRLDEVDPSWSVSYEILLTAQKVIAVATLTVLGRSRSSTGDCDLADNNATTSAEAQSFKRACAAHGIGRYLYFLPKWWADYDAQRKRLTDQGEAYLRQKLAGYFGQPAPATSNPVKRPTSPATPRATSTPTSSPSASVAPTAAATERKPDASQFNPTSFWSTANKLISDGKLTDRNTALGIVTANTGADGVTDWVRAIADLA